MVESGAPETSRSACAQDPTVARHEEARQEHDNRWGRLGDGMEADAAKHGSGEADGRDDGVDVDILNEKTMLTRLETFLIHINR